MTAEQLIVLTIHELLGQTLAKNVIEVCKDIDPEKSAFTHQLQHLYSEKVYGIIMPSEKIRQFITKEHHFKEMKLLPRYVPMLVKPKPWTLLFWWIFKKRSFNDENERFKITI